MTISRPRPRGVYIVIQYTILIICSRVVIIWDAADVVERVDDVWSGWFHHWDRSDSVCYFKVNVQTKAALYLDSHDKALQRMPILQFSETAFAIKWRKWGYAVSAQTEVWDSSSF